MRNGKVRKTLLCMALSAAVMLTAVVPAAVPALAAEPAAEETTTEEPAAEPETPEEPAVPEPIKTALEPMKVASKKSVNVTWNQVDNADYYVIYGKLFGAEEWIKLATVKETDDAETTRSFIYKNSDKMPLTWGKTFVFTVDAYQTVEDADDVLLAQNTVGRKVIMKPGRTKMKNKKPVTYNTNKVSWKKAANADGYYVFRRVAKTKKWKKIGTTDADTTAFADKKAKIGVTYFYTARAIWKKGDTIQKGDYDEKGLKVKTQMAATEIKELESGNSSITVKWKKRKGASGYIVYRRQKGKKFKKIKVVKGGDNVSYKDTDVSLDQKYAYCVKVYKKSGDKTYKSAKSPEKKVLLKIKVKTQTVKDKNSILNGKKIKLYYYADGTRIKDPTPIIGKKGSYDLYINKYKDQIMVYQHDGDCLVPIKTFICSPGHATPTGTFHTLTKMRWHELMGPCWGQWCTKVVSNGIYFHSVFYNSYNNNNALAVSAYNRLGTTCSHGCIRVTAGDAKWIYDNCSIGTKVVIYSKSGYEPLEKPTAYKLSSSHTWDPTDPNMKYKCRKNGCHDV